MESVIKIGKDYSFPGKIVKQSDTDIVCNITIPDDMDTESFNSIMTRDNLSYIVESSNGVDTEYIGYVGSIDIGVSGSLVTLTLSLASLNDVIKDLYKMMYSIKISGTDQTNLWSRIVSYIDNDLATVIVKQL